MIFLVLLQKSLKTLDIMADLSNYISTHFKLTIAKMGDEEGVRLWGKWYASSAEAVSSAITEVIGGDDWTLEGDECAASIHNAAFALTAAMSQVYRLREEKMKLCPSGNECPFGVQKSQYCSACQKKGYSWRGYVRPARCALMKVSVAGGGGAAAAAATKPAAVAAPSPPCFRAKLAKDDWHWPWTTKRARQWAAILPAGRMTVSRIPPLGQDLSDDDELLAGD